MVSLHLNGCGRCLPFGRSFHLSLLGSASRLPLSKKDPMRPYISLLLFLAWGSLVSAQNNDGRKPSVSISASATVVGSDIQLETISEMGIIDASFLQDGLEIYINPVFDPEAGIMRATGMPNAQIRVSYIAEEIVSRREGPGTLNFVYSVSGYPGDNQRESELLELIEHEMHFNERGEFYFWIGGRIDLSDAQPGNYDGEFTIEIEYM